MAATNSAELTLVEPEEQLPSLTWTMCGIDMGNYGYRFAVGNLGIVGDGKEEELRWSSPTEDDMQVKRLLGRKFSDPELQSELPSFPFPVTEGPNGLPVIHYTLGGLYKVMNPVELLHIQLSMYSTEFVKNQNNILSDCCIGIPVHFTYRQRRELFHAATIAGLKPRRLLHETTAASLAYMFCGTDLPKDGELFNMAFIDVGHWSMQVSIIELKPNQLKVLSHCYDKSVGGKEFDNVLFKHFSAKFKVDTSRESHSSLFKLRRSCENLKKELSEKTKTTFNVEKILDDKNVNVSDAHVIKRVEFEKMSTTLLERVKVVLQKSLNEARLTVEDVYSVRVVGNGSKIPAIMHILEDFFGKKPRLAEREDESIDASCFYECCKLCAPGDSPECQIIDILPYSIGLSWKREDGATEILVVFPKNSPLPSVKDLVFHRAGPFLLDLVCINADDSEDSSQVSTYVIGATQGSEVEPVDVTIRVQLNISGFSYIESATVGDNITSVTDISCNNIQPEHVQNSSYSKLETFLGVSVQELLSNLSDVSKELETEKQSLSKETKRRMKAEKILHHERKQQEKANEHRSALERQLEELKGLLEATKKQHEELLIERDNTIKEKNCAFEQVELYQKEVPKFTKFTLSELKKATKNFNNSVQIGEGKYGSVYKGSLRHTTVAIKLPKLKSCQGAIEFNQQVEVLTKIRHPNLVMLIGACPKAQALVYEFLPNGSLDTYLTNGNTSTRTLSWQNRIRIASEICSTLIFLHSIPPNGITHGDLTPKNILLGSNFVSKLTDFGISPIVQQTNKTITPSAYTDPELLSSFKLTPQCDIYSLGIILLQFVTGKDPENIKDFVKEALDAGKLDEIVDDSAGEWPIEEATKLASLGFRCSDSSRENRPELAKDVWPLIESMKRIADLN